MLVVRELTLVVSDIWPGLHARAAPGHCNNTLSVALDAAQDRMGRGDAVKFWMETGMSEKKKSCNC